MDALTRRAGWLETAAKILRYSTPDPYGECILWDGATNDSGYGYVRITKGELGELPRMARVHRVAYWVWRGPFDLDLTIDHTCHVRLCVNPYHLRPQTREVNSYNGNVVRWGLEDWEYELDAGF